jgi:hypothetical protein
MDAERLLAESERGIHLLFDNATIQAAFAQDPARLQRVILHEGPRLQGMIDALLRQPSAIAGRRFLEEQPPELRYVLVLLYFELLDGRLRGDRILH